VKVAGGYLKVHRLYTEGKWQFEHEYNRVEAGEAESTILRKATLSYKKDKDGRYHYKTFTIATTDKGYRWENKGGDYVLYSQEGRIVETGNSFGVLSRYIYQDDRLLSINDRKNMPIYHLEYGAHGKINMVHDEHGRQVNYTWEDERLLTVTDVLGKTTRYSYSDEGQLVSKADESGRKFFITYLDDGSVKSVLSRQGGGHTFSYSHDPYKNTYYVKSTSTMGKIREYWFDEKGETK
ncbi:MAG: RHS repeat protein, partial [Deltaproteobacteria bacterium]|nr:RHS repeat protein [Deltaproteobacteria bacterium]